MNLPIPYLIGTIGIVSVLTSIPLMLRWVPMNRWYGVRTRKAYVSDENWYDINAHGGRLFFGFGLFMVAVAWIWRDLAPEFDEPLAVLFSLLPLVALVPVLLSVWAHGHRMPDK